jgi:hypothetical protein
MPHFYALPQDQPDDDGLSERELNALMAVSDYRTRSREVKDDDDD